MLFAGRVVVLDDRPVLVVAPAALGFGGAAGVIAGQSQRAVAGLGPRASALDCGGVPSPQEVTLAGELLGLFLV